MPLFQVTRYTYRVLARQDQYKSQQGYQATGPTARSWLAGVGGVGMRNTKKWKHVKGHAC